jgi:hypothetical protein
MKNYFKFGSVLLLASLMIIGCTKVGGAAAEDNPDAIDQNDEVFPVITNSKPTDNQVYTSGDSIIVEGVVTDDKIVYKGKVLIKNDANLVLADANYESHYLTAINYRLAYKAIVTAPTDFSILIEFQDHGANLATKTLKVKVNP